MIVQNKIAFIIKDRSSLRQNAPLPIRPTHTHTFSIVWNQSLRITITAAMQLRATHTTHAKKKKNKQTNICDA